MVAKNSIVSGGLEFRWLERLPYGKRYPRRDDLGCSRKEKNDCGRTRRTDLEQSTDELFECPETPVPSASRRRHSKKEAIGFRAERTSVGGEMRRKKQENPLDRLTSFRDDTPMHFQMDHTRRR